MKFKSEFRLRSSGEKQRTKVLAHYKSLLISFTAKQHLPTHR